MDADQLLSVRDTLDAFLARFHAHFGRREQRDQLSLYARGRLGPLERKSLEPIALAEGASPRALQLFLDSRVWDEDGVLDAHQRLVAEKLGDPEGVFIIDATSDAKKGNHTAGVARQYCGESGKIDNCIVTVHWAYAARDSHVLLDGALHLPADWDVSAGEEALQRRAEAGVPDDARHRTHAEMSIEQLRRILRNGVPGRWVTGDAEFGCCWEWREEVADMGLCYVAEVPCAMYGFWRKPHFRTPRAHSRGRRSRRPVPDIRSRRADDVVRFLDPDFEPWRVRDGTKGPDVWNVARIPFWASHGGHAGRTQPGILLVADNALTGERKYYFSNAPADTPTDALLRVAFSRWRVERCFEDAKGELGLNHAETRSWKSIKRHLVLTCILHLFLTLLRGEWGGKCGGVDAEPDRRSSRGNVTCPVQVPLAGRRPASDCRAPRAPDGGDGGAQPGIGPVGKEAPPE